MTYIKPKKITNKFREINRVLNCIYLIFAFIFLGLGLLGAVLPLVPTTPFLLISLYFFAKGSTKFHNWFCNTTIYHKYLKSYVKEKAMTIKTKLSILFFASMTMIILFFIVPIFIAKILIITILIFHWIYFFFFIKTI